jgi:hypothetical protein
MSFLLDLLDDAALDVCLGDLLVVTLDDAGFGGLRDTRGAGVCLTCAGSSPSLSSEMRTLRLRFAGSCGVGLGRIRIIDILQQTRMHNCLLTFVTPDFLDEPSKWLNTRVQITACELTSEGSRHRCQL